VQTSGRGSDNESEALAWVCEATTIVVNIGHVMVDKILRHLAAKEDDRERGPPHDADLPAAR
jgi:hypothetical protein